MISRRSFIKSAGALTLGGSLLSTKSWAVNPPLHPVGVQLFTVLTAIDEDLDGTLKKIAALGYKEIESAFSKKGGFYGLKPKEFKTKVNDMGFQWTSHHVIGAPFKMPAGAKPLTDANGKPIVIPPMKNLRENMQELVDTTAEGGVKYLVCANTPIGTLDEIKSSIEVINKTAEACKKAKLQLAYHNHDAEFIAVEGQIPYDLFLTQFSPDVKFELDLAWATKGGADPVELFKKHPGRFPLWHVKDLDKEFKTVLPVGKGVVQYKRIFDNAATAGMQSFFVEHDFPANAMESLSESITYLNNNILK